MAESRHRFGVALVTRVTPSASCLPLVPLDRGGGGGSGRGGRGRVRRGGGSRGTERMSCTARADCAAAAGTVSFVHRRCTEAHDGRIICMR